MGKIIELRPPPTPSQTGGAEAQPASELTSIEVATHRLMESVAELIGILEASHRRIRVLIDSIPDRDAAARLARDHATLSAALQDAKTKVATLSLPDPTP
jgi:hypothetical protein